MTESSTQPADPTLDQVHCAEHDSGDVRQSESTIGGSIMFGDPNDPMAQSLKRALENADLSLTDDELPLYEEYPQEDQDDPFYCRG